MFAAIGTFVYRMRFAVIAVLIALMGGLGLYGMDLSKHLSQSGWFDPTSESDFGSRMADEALGRDHKSDIILLITPPEGTTVDDPAFGAKVEQFTADLINTHPEIVNRTDPGLISPFYLSSDTPAGRAAQDTIRERTFSDDLSQAFISIGVAGDDDTTVLNNYKTIEPFFDGIAERYDLPGTAFEMAGLQPVAGAMAAGMDDDIKRAEVIALPLVALLLFFVFGGVVAAVLPVLIGGLTIAGSLGIMTMLAQTTELNIFAQSVVTLIGLGIAIDYGLFIVSRFREEMAEGYSTPAAVRRTVMTAGQTVVFSATIIVAALACLLIMPQGFLKSVAYGAIASVTLAAILSVTVLPAILGILGPRVDALGLPFLRRTKTREEIENGFWGRLAGWVMKHPAATAVPTVLFLLLLIVPFGNIQFGGISEAYLPPDNANRVAQENFDEAFPTERTEEIKLVIAYDPNSPAAGAQLASIAEQANEIPGFTKEFSTEGIDSQPHSSGWQITQMSAGLIDRNTAPEAIRELREIDTGDVRMWVAGTPTLTQDSIDALMKRLPLMAILLVLTTSILMFLAFGSLVLPIKAALMTALGLGATLGILTWIFVDGHGAGIANFTPGPLFAAILVLIIAIVFGLSTDYEIFLMSRMVEARAKGASTTEAVRLGTAHTGHIITAAAAILIVVTGAFGLSDIVMMKYIAFGMIAALILDATIIRMLLVPSVMKLLGDDCWWAPRWMQTVQRKIGLGETVLEDEPDELRDDARESRMRSSGSLVAEAPTSVMPSARALRAAAIDTGGRPLASQARRTPPPMPTPSGPAGAWAGPPPAQNPAPAPAPSGARRGPSAPPSGWTVSGPLPTSPTPPATAPARPAPEVTPTPADASTSLRRSRLGRGARPDTGNWSLGKSGIRSGSFPAIPKDPAPEASTPTPSTVPPPAPESRRRPSQPPVGQSPESVPSPRPSSDDSVLARRPELQQTGKRPLAASLSPEDEDDASGKRARSTDRHANREGDGKQISVQDLLRRSKSD